MKIFYRVGNTESNQGLWYDMQGNFTGLIHDKYKFCKNNGLPMPFDKNICGYLSAVDNLDDLFAWVTHKDIAKLKKHGYRVLEYRADDYKFYNGHWLINQHTSVVNQIIDELPAKKKEINPHGWFFQYLQTVGDDDKDEARKAIVFDYSGGKTESLSELYALYPRFYNKMKTDLLSAINNKPQKPKADDGLDIHRKRLIAAIFETLEDQDIKGKSFDYVKSVACKAANVDRFNDIPLPTLKSLYRKFGEKNLNSQVKELISATI